MASIRELSGEVINKIAAGEVVERPAQLLKELLENSLDAEATEITIDVKEGGRTIQVTDNGVGIPAEELPLVLARHTTSKITEVDDLWKLRTFGFRGEALASIASIAKLTLTSRQKKNGKAGRLYCEFGKMSDVEIVAAPVGTTVLIESLFENVPARLKFLKSSAAEIGAIRQVLRAIALSHPQVTFRLRVDDSLDLFWSGVKGNRERATQVLEQDSMHEGARSADGYEVTTAFSDPGTVAKTSKNIWLFAQNRWIQDRGLQAAVTEAYRGTLMHGEYPIAVVWLNVPADEIDVNIHPTKSQVKFQDNGKVFRLIHHAIRDELEKVHSAKKAPRPTQPANLVFASTDLQRTHFQQKELPNYAPPAVVATHVQPVVFPVIAAPEVKVTEPVRVEWGKLQVLGQALLTYIVAQEHEQLVFIDQHAAHERVLFETIKAGWNQGKMERQQHLFPVTIDLTAEKVEALLKFDHELEKLGLAVESMGPATIGVASTPPFLKESILPKLFDQVATEIIDHGGSYSFERKMNDIAATMACHSAIRAGQALSPAEMQALLAQMDQFSFSSFCPHGRPVAVRWNQAQIEREFGRRS